HAMPGLARVGRLVDAVAEMRAALARVLARAEPDDVRILRVDNHATQRERSAVVENRRERDAAIGGLPQTAEGGRDIPRVRIPGIDGDVLHAAGGNRGADAPEFESLEDVGGQAIGGRRRLPRTDRNGCADRGKPDRSREHLYAEIHIRCTSVGSPHSLAASPARSVPLGRIPEDGANSARIRPAGSTVETLLHARA